MVRSGLDRRRLREIDFGPSMAEATTLTGTRAMRRLGTGGGSGIGQSAACPQRGRRHTDASRRGQGLTPLALFASIHATCLSALVTDRALEAWHQGAHYCARMPLCITAKVACGYDATT